MKIHIVQKGDTLWELSKKYGVDFEELKQANSQLSSPDMIMPGMKIKIPSTSKTVKSGTALKETQKKETKQGYQDNSPKPMPVIKEDDHNKEMIAKPEMPVQQLPQMPSLPLTQMPAQPIMQMPVMEQDFQNYTTINFPQMPQYHEVEEEKPKKEHVKAKTHPVPKPMPKPQEQHQHMPQPMPEPQLQHHMPQPMPEPQLQHHMPQPMPNPQPQHHMPQPMPNSQPQFQPMPPQQAPVNLIPLCCHIVHPCCPPVPFPLMVNATDGFNPANQMQQHQIPFNSMPFGGPPPNMEMPVNPMHSSSMDDCGCNSNAPIQQPVMTPYPSGTNTYDIQQPMSHSQQQMPETNMYPPQFNTSKDNNNPYPSPPAYPNFPKAHAREEDKTKSE